MVKVEEQELKRLQARTYDYEVLRGLCQTMADCYNDNDTKAMIVATDAIYNFIYPPAIGVKAEDGIKSVDVFGGR